MSTSTQTSDLSSIPPPKIWPELNTEQTFRFYNGTTVKGILEEWVVHDPPNRWKVYLTVVSIDGLLAETHKNWVGQMVMLDHYDLAGNDPWNVSNNPT